MILYLAITPVELNILVLKEALGSAIIESSSPIVRGCGGCVGSRRSCPTSAILFALCPFQSNLIQKLFSVRLADLRTLSFLLDSRSSESGATALHLASQDLMLRHVQILLKYIRLGGATSCPGMTNQ